MIPGGLTPADYLMAGTVVCGIRLRNEAVPASHHAPCSAHVCMPRGRTGMMPILHSPGLMMPGQLGPINRVADCSLSARFTSTCKQS